MKRGKVIFLLFLLALGVRLIITWNTYAMPSDGPRYIEVASYYAEGNLKEALKHDYHPLFPCFMAVAHQVIGNWEWAGMLVSVLLGSLAVIPLYLIGQRVFNDTIATITAVFYAFHPHTARLSSDILTTGTFIFLLVSTLYLIMEALKGWKYRMFLFAGLSSLLAYLTRPDGVILLLVCVAWIILSNFSGRPDRQAGWWKGAFRKKILALGLLCLPWIIGLASYMCGLKYARGEWQLSQKLSRSKIARISGISGIQPSITGEKRKGFVYRQASALYIVTEDFVKAANPWLLLLIIIGLFTRKKFLQSAYSVQNKLRLLKSHPDPVLNTGEGSHNNRDPSPRQVGAQDESVEKFFNALKLNKWIIWSTVLIYLMALWRFALCDDRISKRYTTPLIVIISFWGAIGLYVLIGWLYQKFNQQDVSPGDYPARLPQRQVKWLIVGVLITIGSFAIFTFAPVRYHRLDEKRVGEWIKRYHQTATQPLIIAPSNLIMYHGGSRILDHHKGGNQIKELGSNYEEAIKNARFKQADYLVINHKTKNYIPDFTASIKPKDLELIYEIQPDKSEQWFKVYKVKK